MAAKVGVKGKIPDAEQVQRHESTQRAVRIQWHVSKGTKGLGAGGA